jgi:hypothetical protein
MPVEDPGELDDVDREIRINELKSEAEKLTGGKMHAWEAPDCPPEMAESFWQRVVDYEKAPLTTHFQQLTDAGVDLPAPEAMTDAEVTAKLWEVIERLAAMRVFLSNTDHLSDRDLYARLWGDLLREEVADLPFDEDSAWHIDVLGSGSDEDIDLHMKFYADDDYRSDWLKQFPDYQMPAHEDPPYQRDRRLPQSRF